MTNLIPFRHISVDTSTNKKIYSLLRNIVDLWICLWVLILQMFSKIYEEVVLSSENLVDAMLCDCGVTIDYLPCGLFLSKHGTAITSVIII